VVVCAPELLATRCNSVEQMRLVNALCAFAEEASSRDRDSAVRYNRSCWDPP